MMAEHVEESRKARPKRQKRGNILKIKRRNAQLLFHGSTTAVYEHLTPKHPGAMVACLPDGSVHELN